jgi:hypothetical protein
MKTFVCARCKTTFKRYPSQRTKATTFCSRSCLTSFHVGKNAPNYKGGCLSVKGYRLQGAGKSGKVVYEHRLIAEKVLGRPLKRDEVVHHINGDKTDNRNSNLLICTRQYHQWLHMEMSLRYAREKFGPQVTA